MTEASPPAPPPAGAHSDAHEERILAAAFGDDADDSRELAELIADCDPCLTRTLRILDELFALHAVGGRPAEPAAIARLEALLDQVMVLRGQRASDDPAG